MTSIRGSSPPGEVNRRGKRKNRPGHRSGDARLYGCPLYKNNPRRYSPNKGAKYRPCAGPGFKTISHLKQHLKRKHSAPTNQCLRCWTVTSNRADLQTHQNADERCQPGPRPPPNGVDQDKLELIYHNRGLSWEGIYETLFPGKDIPDPYHEPFVELADSPRPNTTKSQELRDFEAYSQTVLHSVVERLLQDEIVPHMTQVEEHFRTRLVEIVRTTFSTVLHNFRLDNPRSSLSVTTAPETHLARLSSPAHNTAETARLDGIANAANTKIDDEPTDFAQRPFSSTTGGSAPMTGSLPDYSRPTACAIPGTEFRGTDLTSACDCSCHNLPGPLNSAYGRQSCQTCSWMHLDLYGPDYL